MIRCIKRKPGPFLAPFINYYFLFEQTKTAGDLSFQRVTPDGCFELNFNLCAPLERKESDGRVFEQNDFYVVGRHYRNYLVNHSEHARMFGIRFYPGGLRPFIRSSSSDIVDQFVTQEEIFGSKIKLLHDRVLNSATMDEKIQRVEDFFQQLYLSRNEDLLVTDAVRKIANSRGNIDLDRLSSSYNLSSRRIQQRFNNSIGVSPKMFSRLIKFRFSLKRLHFLRPGEKLTQLAYECGYYDQAHFIHDFKSFAGVSPQKYLVENHVLNRLISSE